MRTKKVIELAGPLTLAFLPYGYNLKALTSRAIANNHELLVHLPMQPHAANADPGPNALLRTLSEIQIRSRIDWNLSQFPGFVGINNHMGSNFTTWESGMSFVMEEMKTRFHFFHNKRHTTLPRRKITPHMIINAHKPGKLRKIPIDSAADLYLA